MRSAAAAAGLLAAGAACAQASAWELGLRGGIAVAGGRPANDIEASGLALRWKWDERWSLQASAQSLVFDVERPAAILGLQQSSTIEAIDAKARATLVSVGVRRDSARGASPWSWFWGAELGAASPKVPDASGPLEGGGSFDVQTKAGREWIVSAHAGARYTFGSRLAAELALQADHHRADWQLTDRVSGRSGRIGSYSAAGLWLGLVLRFD